MKAQTEILGLVMVVLLISIGMLFTISFVVFNQGNDIRGAYIDKETATYLNYAILDSTSSCMQISYQRLIIDCVERGNGGIQCPDPSNNSSTAPRIGSCS